MKTTRFEPICRRNLPAVSPVLQPQQSSFHRCNLFHFWFLTCLLLSLQVHAQTPDLDAPAPIPDPVLRHSIQLALKKLPTSTITFLDLQSLTQLNVNAIRIGGGDEDDYIRVKMLNGLEYATQLKVLNISRLGALHDLMPIRNLTQLEELRMPSNQLEDLKALRGLTNLVVLDLDDNPRLNDLGPLQVLKKLQLLSVEGAEIKDLEPISTLTNITVLDLDFNQIENLVPLVNLTQIKELDLNGNRIRDIAALSGMKDLESLDIDSNRIQSIEPISAFTKLNDLDLMNNFVSDISPLTNLITLTNLVLSGNQIRNLNGLDALTNLAWVDLVGNEIDLANGTRNDAIRTTLLGRGVRWGDLPQFVDDPSSPIPSARLLTALFITLSRPMPNPLTVEELNKISLSTLNLGAYTHGPQYNMRLIHSLQGLEHLELLSVLLLNEVQISDLSNLPKQFPKLSGLDIQDMPLQTQSMEGIAGCTNLVYLQIRGAGLRDTQAAPLAKLTQLQNLFISNNSLESLDPIASLTNLTYLDIRNNNILTLAPVSNLSELVHLYAERNQISSAEPLIDLTKLQVVHLARNHLSSMPVWKTGTPISSLTMSRNSLTSVDSITNLTVLNYLDLDHNRIERFPVSSNLTSLISIDLADNRISDLTPLRPLIRLQYLDLDENRIVDLEPISQLPALYGIDLHGNLIRNVVPLVNSPALLTDVRLDGNFLGTGIGTDVWVDSARSLETEVGELYGRIRLAEQNSLGLTVSKSEQGLTLGWNGTSRVDYRIESSGDLKTWVPMDGAGEKIVGRDEVQTVQLSGVSGQERRFYRLQPQKR